MAKKKYYNSMLSNSPSSPCGLPTESFMKEYPKLNSMMSQATIPDSYTAANQQIQETAKGGRSGSNPRKY